MVCESKDCDYQTIDNSTFLRHKSKIFPCHKTIIDNNFLKLRKYSNL